MNKDLVKQIIEQRRLFNRIIRENTTDPWANLNLTLPQLRSLFYISRHGKVNLSGLAAGIKVTPANVTGIVDRLIEHEMVTRTPDPDDRRVLWLNLTDKAKTLIFELREGRASEMGKILENLSGEELFVVSNSYRLLIKSAKETRLSVSGEEGSRFTDDGKGGVNNVADGEQKLYVTRRTV